ncbi:autoinducer prepeptide [Clostridioides difficile]|nr:cyclic lactone autoinducer peptide [Clostridioides difficile]VFF93670.1 autoinducer prepeptide [Clostridioides difficile]VIG09041.1 autoinducer prepeptide [Clostridioides difficile]HBF4772687.1 cyclic lactone autoinducer peptide [Clostridioides difficile]HBF5038236.1 cyclic lactone autoinducer peptide [Clostridioides difficile]HBF5411094.1 cyclic lactone autoinducer peptide [Clostridioides difficile]
MNKYSLKILKCLSLLSLVTALMSVNTTCTWFNHQPNLPDDLKKFKINGK